MMLRKALNKDMDSAAAIQRAFLPDPLLMSGHASNLEIFSTMRPAKEVGGDLYDVFFVTENKLAITTGDDRGVAQETDCRGRARHEGACKQGQDRQICST
jgi:hypothetical protein